MSRQSQKEKSCYTEIVATEYMEEVEMNDKCHMS